MTNLPANQPSRILLRQFGIALMVGVCVGALAFLIARGIGGVIILGEQREQFSGMAGSLGNLDTLPPLDLRSMRLRLEALDQYYYRISIITGLLVGTGAALATYVRGMRG